MMATAPIANVRSATPWTREAVTTIIPATRGIHLFAKEDADLRSCEENDQEYEDEDERSFVSSLTEEEEEEDGEASASQLEEEEW